MLAHELAHLAGHDPAWHLLADLVTAFWWWHPAVWWARHRLRAASETAADEASLLRPDGPTLLAACLVELGKRLTRPRPAGWVRMAGSGFRSSLGRRVERLLRLDGQPRQPPSRLRFALALSLGAAVLLATALLSTAWAHSQASLEEEPSMKTLHLSWKRSMAGLVLCTALGVGPEVAHGDDLSPQPTPQERPDPAAAPQRAAEPRAQPGPGTLDLFSEGSRAPTLRIRVFRLSHREPEEIQQILAALLEVQPSWGRGRGSSRGMAAGGMMPGAPGGLAAGRGLASQSLSGGMMGSAVGGSPSSWRLAVDPRTRSIIVRGTERDLETVADVVALLDLPPGKPLPKVKNLHAYRLRHANAEELTQVLQTLDLAVRIVPMPQANLLIMAGSEEAMKEIASVIEELDVERKPAAKPQEQ
jgi:hypothetical protein